MVAAADAQKICKQVEFYFSDSNLPYDKFLWTLRSNTPEGWIPVETIASFKKMKMISEDLEAIIKALEDHKSEIYELDAESKNIRRKSEVVQQDHNVRSIYIKGLPLVDIDTKDPVAELFLLQDKIDDLFSEHAKVLCVRFKKTNDRPKKFKGSAYIEFETAEDAKKVAELKEIEFEGKKLEILYKPAYHELKAAQYKDSPAKYTPKNFPFNAFKPHNDFKAGMKRKDTGFAKAEPKKSKVEENKAEENKVEEPKAEDSKAEEAKVVEEAK